MKSWFRLYAEVVDDPKVQRLPAELFKAWVNFMCLTARNNGRFISVSDTAFGLRISEDDARFILTELTTLGLLEMNAKTLMYRPHNWTGRQFESDVSTERVRRFRERFRNVSGNAPDQNRTEKPPIPPKVSQEYTPEFLEFWEAYPEKTGKRAAFAVWKSLNPTAELRQKILSALKWQRKSPDWTKQGGQFIPDPERWLKKGKWDDEPPKQRALPDKPVPVC